MHIKLLLFAWPFYCKENENTKQESNLQKRENKSLGVEEKADNSGCHTCI